MKTHFFTRALICAQLAFVFGFTSIGIASVTDSWNCGRRIVLQHEQTFYPLSERGSGNTPIVSFLQERDAVRHLKGMETALQPELVQAIQGELDRVYGSQAPRLSQLERSESELPDFTRFIQWKLNGRVIVERAVFFDRRNAKAGQLIEVRKDGTADWGSHLSEVVVFGPTENPESVLVLGYALSTDSVRADVAMNRFVESAVPHVRMIYRLRTTEVAHYPHPDREEQKARTIRRDRERAYKAARVDTEAHDEWERVVFNYHFDRGILAYWDGIIGSYDYATPGGKRRRPRPDVEQVITVTEKLAYRAPDIYENPVSLSGRLIKHATRLTGGGVSYAERDLAGRLLVEVQCNDANYCEETWYEADGTVVAKVNGQGHRILREVDRHDWEVFPNEVYPFNPNLIPSQSDRRRPAERGEGGAPLGNSQPLSIEVVGDGFRGYTVRIGRGG